MISPRGWADLEANARGRRCLKERGRPRPQPCALGNALKRGDGVWDNSNARRPSQPPRELRVAADEDVRAPEIRAPLRQFTLDFLFCNR